ncbi:patched domain-containing protein 3-like [Antedon mediterranea]|uniref:patched domain-containing protein 3-like n=1 Tax=Antedon mediterranea TaxID=105859 RepID=UPI003AF925D5
MTVQKSENCCKHISNAVISTFEKLFSRIGSFIGRYPSVCIVISIAVTIIFGTGLLLINEENRREKLWIPSESDNQNYFDYVSNNYKDPFYELLVFENKNMLTPESLKAMLKIDEEVKAINVGKSWESICARFGGDCYVSSILELWGFNRTVIESLTQEDIIKKINNESDLISLVTQRTLKLSSLLGGVDNETYITGAKASRVIYGLTDNKEFDESEGRQVDRDAEDWETEFIEIGTSDYEDMNVYVLAYTSFDTESANAINGDLMILVFGYALLLVYIIIMLSKFTLVEHRVYIAICGVATVGFSIVVAIGFCSMIGLIYTPVHSVLPFLLLGIGVDDMFVIVQSWDNLSKDEKKMSIPEQCSLALKHAGVAVTVTSVTDISAFLIGATTILPALRSFCVFCGIGIIFLFFFSIMFFTPMLCLDMRRVNNKRDACCCCYQHGDDYKPSECGQKNRFQIVFDEIYSPLLIKTPVKIVVVIITAVLLGFGIWGFIDLEQFFNFRWFLPSDSYATYVLEVNDIYYPENGVPSAIYLNNVDLFSERSAVNTLYNDAINNKFIDSNSFSNWYEEFEQWIQTNKWNEQEYNNETMWPDTHEAFVLWVNEFLLDPTGGDTFKADVIFDNSTSLEIISSRISFAHIVLKGSTEEVDAMDSIQEFTANFEFEGDGYAFAFSENYIQYESNKVIQEELFRNLGLACVCVFLIILLLLANLKACLLVFLAVMLTLVDLAGFVHHWGLTIDVVVTIQLILSIGIAVDYAAHIGHMFMTVTGTRNDRVLKTLQNIGSAVFNGGFSTFLAFALLSLSTSYVFRTFFKIFLLVVIFGLFHGLVLLPVLLSWFGPEPYPSAGESPDSVGVENNVTETRTRSVGVNSSGLNGNNDSSIIIEANNLADKAQFDNPASVKNDLDIPNLPEYPIDCLSKLEFNQEVIEKHINEIDSHKASGNDGLSNIVFTLAAKPLAFPCKILFERCISEKRFPIKWKQANVYL